MTARIGLVWAEASGGVIGAGGVLPWHVPEDLAHFRAVTADAPVIMGRKTWESLPERFRPLPGRRNIVVTRSAERFAEGAEQADSLAGALDGIDGRAWVIGGGELFREAIGLADLLEVTELDLTVDGDTFAPSKGEWIATDVEPGEGWSMSRSGIRYRFLTLGRPS